jgi:hypothetical protein
MYGDCSNGAKAINIYSVDPNSFAVINPRESDNPIQ